MSRQKVNLMLTATIAFLATIALGPERAIAEEETGVACSTCVKDGEQHYFQQDCCAGGGMCRRLPSYGHAHFTPEPGACAGKHPVACSVE